MTKKEILRAAIEKATEREYCLVPNDPDKLRIVRDVDGDYTYYNLWGIYDHDFAKAFFGEKESPDYPLVIDKMCPRRQKAWEYHLQQMVLAPDPIQYLAKFIK